MSSRQLRKLQKQRELEQLEAAKNANASAETSEDDAPFQRPRPNAFAGFAALGGGDDDGDNDDDDEDANPPEDSHEAVATPAFAEKPNTSAKKSKKKKKKKGKKAGNTTPSKTNTPMRVDSDDIDEALRELNLSDEDDGASATAQGKAAKSVAYERICELLRINTYYLKVVNEMRALFGREAIATATREENEENVQHARRTRHAQENVDLETFLKGIPGRPLPDVTLRRNPFLPGKESWPRADTEGLTMTQIHNDASTGTVEFAFTHSVNYNRLEQTFFQLVKSLDPMQIVHFLHRHPYHISSLIQVSKVAKQDQNAALAADLCERALFTFGRVSLSTFRQKLEEGKARLNFFRPENRQFWLAGYCYMKNLAMKGAYRTALEWAKLLFSMDWKDPYGLIHLIHPMAIRAHESLWFIDFCDSEALDQFDGVQNYIRQTLVLARLQLKDRAGAKALLLEGLTQLPWLYDALYKALNLDIPKAIWGVQMDHPHERLHIELYLHQAKSLWDNTQAIDLLKEVAREAKKPENNPDHDATIVRENVVRFIFLDNTRELMAHLPDGLLNWTPNWDFDPIPPIVESNVFSHESQQWPWTTQPMRDDSAPLRDEQAMRDYLARVRARGGPQELEAFLLAALRQFRQGEAGAEAGTDPGTDDHDDNNDNDIDVGEMDTPDVGAEPDMLQLIMGLFARGGRVGDGEESGSEEVDADIEELFVHARSSDESGANRRMPGAWDSDSDDEHHASGNAADNETSD